MSSGAYTYVDFINAATCDMAPCVDVLAPLSIFLDCNDQHASNVSEDRIRNCTIEAVSAVETLKSPKHLRSGVLVTPFG